MTLIFRLLCVLALAIGGVLYMYYVNPLEAGICGLESGCEAVRKSGGAYFGSTFVNIPLFGTLAFLALLSLSFFQKTWKLARLGGFIAGAGGLYLIMVQLIQIGAICSWCMSIDSVGVACAVMAALLPSEFPGGDSPLRWSLLGFWALLVGPIWSLMRPIDPVPAEILAMYEKGKINVVEFVDPTCEHCQQLHQMLREIEAEDPQKNLWKIQRKLMPRERIEGAVVLASAIHCAGLQGQEEKAVDIAMRSELRETVIKDIVGLPGLDLDKFESCTEAEETAEVFEGNFELARRSGLLGLPMIYIGGRKLIGSPPRFTVNSAFRGARAELSGGFTAFALPAWIYVPLQFLFGALLYFATRRAKS